MKHITFISLSCIFKITQCYKILIIFPMASPSHNILGMNFAKELSKRSFEVTYVSPFSVENKPENFTNLILDGIYEWYTTDFFKKVDYFSLEHQNIYQQTLVLNTIGDLLGNKLFNHHVIKNLLNSKDHYDAVILEEFANDALKIFGYHFQAPLIMFSTMGATKWINNLAANPSPLSYIPEFFTTFDINNPTFFDRLHNFLIATFTQANLDYLFYPQQNKFLKKFYPNAPDLTELQSNISLFLLNSHESIYQAIPTVPNIISIGGYHVETPKPLPTDLQRFMDNATEGVIYFSMGSNLIPSNMPVKTKQVILKVLANRKEKVLWKWNKENMPEKPRNVKISKWFPQPDILAHPNCKLFITHGGLLSTTETVYHGVPVLAFPIFGDQKLNAARVEALGFGKSLPFSTINEENLKAALEELLENPKYKENAIYRSKIFHDRPLPPMNLAAYWINYVIRNQGAPHLRVAGKDLPYYKYYMLDVFAFIGFVVLVLVYLFKKLISIVLNRKIKAKLD